MLAVIESIQLPRNEQWQIVHILADDCTNQDDKIKNGDITTMGYICRKINNADQTIKDSTTQMILSSIIMGARQGPESIKTSLKALEDSLPFFQTLMSQAKYHDTVFQIFVDNFLKDLQIESTYFALFEFVKLVSPHLSDYEKALCDLAEVHLQRRDQATKLNLQLWENIGINYGEQISAEQRIYYRVAEDNFLQEVSEKVLPLIMQCLLILNEDSQQYDNLHTSASGALQAFAKVCDISVVEKIKSSVSTILQSSEPYHQQASVTLLSTICEYPDREYTNDIVSRGFDHFFNLLSSQNKTVVGNSLMGFIRMAQMLPQIFLTHKKIAEIIDTLMEYVKMPEYEIRFIAIQILANISEGLKDYPYTVVKNPAIYLKKIVQYYSENMEKMHQEQPSIILKKYCSEPSPQLLIRLLKPWLQSTVKQRLSSVSIKSKRLKQQKHLCNAWWISQKQQEQAFLTNPLN